MVIAKDRTLHLRVLVRNAIYYRYKPFMSIIDFRLLLFYIYEGNILCLHTGSDLQYNPMDIINVLRGILLHEIVRIQGK